MLGGTFQYARRESFLALTILAYTINMAILGFYVLVAHAFSGFTQSSCWWDCGWYMGIAQSGYAHLAINTLPAGAQKNWAFFPLFPELVRLVHKASGLSINLSALTLNNVILPAMIAMTGWYSKRFRSINPYAVIFLISASPFSLYFRVEYSETVYGALLVAILILVSLDWMWTASIFGALFSVSRPTAAPVLVAFGLWYFVRAYSAHGLDGALKSAPKVIAFGVIGALGLGAYMLYLYQITGDALAFVRIETGWQRRFGNPFLNILRGIETPGLTAASFVNQGTSQRYLGLSCLVTIMLIFYGTLKRLWIECLIILITLLLATSTSLMSTPRFFFGNPITFIIIGRLIQPVALEYQGLLYGIMFMFHAIVVVLWYNHARFLM